MDVSSFPTYPPPLRSESDTTPVERPLGPRQVRTLAVLVCLAGTVPFHFCLWSAPDTARRPTPPPRTAEPLSYPQILERFSRVRVSMGHDEIVGLLGWYEKGAAEPEFHELNARIAAHPDRYPRGDHFWAKWADPADRNRWVAVYFAGGVAHHTLKKVR